LLSLEGKGSLVYDANRGLVIGPEGRELYFFYYQERSDSYTNWNLVAVGVAKSSKRGKSGQNQGLL
jgi:hypothetical protein